MAHWGTTHDKVSGCNSEAIPVSPCHFTNEKSEYDQPTLYKCSTTWPTLSTYLKEQKVYLHRSGNTAMNLHGDTIKWILHGLTAAPPAPAFKGLLIRDCFQKKLQVPAQSVPPTNKTKAPQEPNSAKYSLSCRDIPQHSWQRTDLPSPLGLPPREDPQELDWKGLWKEKKSKCYGHMPLHGHCCFCPRACPPHSCLFTEVKSNRIMHLEALGSCILLPATGKDCSHGADGERKFLKVLSLAASQMP